MAHTCINTHNLAGGWGWWGLGCTWFSCRNRWPQLWRDDHREDGGQEPAREGGMEGRRGGEGGGRTKAGRNDQAVEEKYKEVLK